MEIQNINSNVNQKLKEDVEQCLLLISEVKTLLCGPITENVMNRVIESLMMTQGYMRSNLRRSKALRVLVRS